MTKAKASKNKKSSNDSMAHNKKKLVIVFFSVIGVWLLGTVFMMWWSGQIGYMVANMQCGHQPIIASDFMAGYSYVVPGDRNYHYESFAKYYCSESEAKAQGFRHEF